MVSVICDTLGISALSKHFSLLYSWPLFTDCPYSISIVLCWSFFLSVLLTAKPTMAGWVWRHHLHLPPLLSNIITTRFVLVRVLDPPRSQL